MKTRHHPLLHINIGYVVFALVVGWFAIRLALAMSNFPIQDGKFNVLASGEGIYKSVLANVSDVNNELKPVEVPLAKSDLHRNSNEYLVSLVTNEVLQVLWSFFRGPDINSAPGKFVPEEPESIQWFKAENNFWSVVADLSIDDLGAPFLISRNLDEEALIPANKAAGPPRISDKVVDLNYVIVVRMGGAVEKIPLNELTWERLNPTGLSNKILHPGVPLGEVAN